MGVVGFEAWPPGGDPMLPKPGMPGRGLQPPSASTCLSLRALSRTAKSAMRPMSSSKWSCVPYSASARPRGDLGGQSDHLRYDKLETVSLCI
jgi:hypothetical protein